MSKEAPSLAESTVQFPHIAAEINAMAKSDQDMREKNLRELGSWDGTLDAKNTERMKKLWRK
ncbi:hypothetical protein HY972_01525 [Candidatus Kaiserbacteria bacterium]|nr:hypothetical protein [Candidatus Kaiserbacteria bacterium]